MMWWRALRRRFGAAAPLAVRRQLPWPLRLLIGAVLIVLSGVLAVWAYQSGQRAWGGASAEEWAKLQAEVSRLTQENADLRFSTATVDKRMQIETATQTDLARQMQTLQEENAHLKDELAVLNSLVAGDKHTLAVRRGAVEKTTVAGEYRYKFLVTAGGRSDAMFKGRVQLTLTYQAGGNRSQIVLPGERERSGPPYLLDFKYYQRVEGSFRIPANTTLKEVQVKVFEQGATEPKATQALPI